MISQYDIKRFAEKHPDKCWFSVDGGNVINKENGNIVATLEEITQLYREAAHCDFESVYYCHATLEDVIRCKQCGTVIFSTEDVSGFDPNLCCPNCGGYETGLEYWTAEEIAKDEKKQATIRGLEQAQKYQNEADERYKRRGKHDWQIWEGKIELWSRMVSLELVCNNLFTTKLKGLSLKVELASKDDDGLYITDKCYYIPLSFSALKVCLQIKKLRKEGKL